MEKRVEAIYQAGFFRPLRTVELPENERVTLTINRLDDDLDHEFLERARSAAECMSPLPALEDTRERLRNVTGSFADIIAAERARG